MNRVESLLNLSTGISLISFWKYFCSNNRKQEKNIVQSFFVHLKANKSKSLFWWFFFLCFEVWGFSYLHFFYWLWLLSCLDWTVKFLMVSNRSLTNIYLTASRKEINFEVWSLKFFTFCNLFPTNHCNSYKLTKGTLSWNIINQNKMFNIKL